MAALFLEKRGLEGCVMGLEQRGQVIAGASLIVAMGRHPKPSTKGDINAV
jgi:hypothetical protein